MTTLVIAELEGNAFECVTLNAIQAATEISFFGNGVVHVLVTGPQCKAAAEFVAEIVGVSEVFYAEALAHDEKLAGLVANRAFDGTTHYSHIVASNSPRWQDVASKVAGRLNVVPVHGVVRIVNGYTFEANRSEGDDVAVVRSDDVIKVLTICPSSFTAARTCGGHAMLTSIESAPRGEQVFAAGGVTLRTSAVVRAGSSNGGRGSDGWR